MANYSNMYAGDPNKPQNKFKLKDKLLGKNSDKVSHMGPGSMGPPPKQGFSDNQNMVPPPPGHSKVRWW